MMGSQGNMSKEEIIQKIKDDGDFDRLRLMIVRKLKDKEDLRNSIISMVKQSEALNHPGNENLKPRQFCDAIYKEIQTDAIKKVSDSVWEIIRSDDGKSEITKTVETVYNKSVNPQGSEGNSASPNTLAQLQNGTGNITFHNAPISEVNDPISDNELNEPPGFSMTDTHQNNSHGEQKEDQLRPIPSERGSTVEHKEESNNPHVVLEPHDVDHGVPPGFSGVLDNIQACDGSDEDPDVPPGFG